MVRSKSIEHIFGTLKIPGAHFWYAQNLWSTFLVRSKSIEHIFGTLKIPGAHFWYAQNPWSTFLVPVRSVTSSGNMVN